MNESTKAAPWRHRSRKFLAWTGALALGLGFIVTVYVAARLADDEPVTYEDDAEHFKYGSTGGERGWKQQFGFGIPYWLWIALPELFPEHLPDGEAGRGYGAFGMIYEDGRDPRFELPIGMSMRRVQGVDRVYFNCAACHTGSVRNAAGAERQIVLGMPANTFDLGALMSFMEDASQDWRFRSNRLLPKIRELESLREREYPQSAGYRPAPLGFVDRELFRYLAIPMMRDQLMGLLGRLGFMRNDTWGPGRVDTFNSPKALLGFRMDNAPERELVGNADFPSIWNQKARKGMRLHWDGNNCSVDERNLSAGFGTGATPATLDREKLLRVADWLWETAQPPAFPAARIDTALAARGKTVYMRYCRDCHGERSAPYRTAGGGGRVGEVTPIAEIGTDRRRLDSYTRELAQSQNTIYAGHPLAGDEACLEYYENVCTAGGDDARYRELRNRCYPARFRHFRKTNGYANMPLDGLWLRAPYLHNGSVPTLRALLEPAAGRPQRFYIGYDVYDYDDVGFESTSAGARAQGWLYDTARPGNGNQGHEGRAYGTELDAGDKDALVEYLKTF